MPKSLTKQWSEKDSPIRYKVTVKYSLQEGKEDLSGSFDDYAHYIDNKILNDDHKKLIGFARTEFRLKFGELNSDKLEIEISKIGLEVY